MSREFKRVRPGGQISARDFNELQRTVESLQRTHGISGLRTGPVPSQGYGGIVQDSSVYQPFYARIIDADPGDRTTLTHFINRTQTVIEVDHVVGFPLTWPYFCRIDQEIISVQQHLGGEYDIAASTLWLVKRGEMCTEPQEHQKCAVVETIVRRYAWIEVFQRNEDVGSPDSCGYKWPAAETRGDWITHHNGRHSGRPFFPNEEFYDMKGHAENYRIGRDNDGNIVIPAFECKGFVEVPTDGRAIVQMWLGYDSQTYYLFEFWPLVCQDFTPGLVQQVVDKVAASGATGPAGAGGSFFFVDEAGIVINYSTKISNFSVGAAFPLVKVGDARIRDCHIEYISDTGNQYTVERREDKGQRNGYVPLNALGKIDPAYIDRDQLRGEPGYPGPTGPTGPAGSGTVTSVGLAMPTEYTVTNSPVTTNGTLTATKAIQPANTSWMGPTSGADAQPTFRTIVANDIPSLDTSKLTSGTLPVARGGTNSTAALSNNRIIVSSAGAMIEAAAMTNGQLLIGSTSNPPVVAAISAGTNILVTNGAGSITVGITGTIAVANGGTNSSTALNSNRIMVSSGGSIVEAAAMTNGQLLIGSTGAAPMVASLTAGSFMVLTVGAGSVTIAKGNNGSSGDNTSTDAYVELTSQTNSSGLGLCFSIKNTGGGNQITLQIVITDAYGTSETITTILSVGGYFIVDSWVIITGTTTVFPPFTTLTFNVKSTVAGQSATYSYRQVQV